MDERSQSEMLEALIKGMSDYLDIGGFPSSDSDLELSGSNGDDSGSFLETSASDYLNSGQIQSPDRDLDESGFYGNVSRLDLVDSDSEISDDKGVLKHFEQTMDHELEHLEEVQDNPEAKVEGAKMSCHQVSFGKNPTCFLFTAKKL